MSFDSRARYPGVKNVPFLRFRGFSSLCCLCTGGTTPSFCNSEIKMASFVYLLLLVSFLVPGYAQIQSSDQAYISLLISQRGLDFVKDLLINKAISSIVPLQLPNIEKSVKIPVVGNVHVVFSNITLYEIHVVSSYVKPGDTGISIVASGTTCNLNMNWHYSYSTWIVPIPISDSGSASVQVEGMEIGLTLDLEDQEGSLNLVLEDCGCYVKDISIKLDGGASWLYQGMIDAFEGKIGSAVENAITKKLKEVVPKLDLFLRNLPKEIAVDDNAALNVTFVNDPLLSNSSVGFEINGLFMARNVAVPNYKYQHKDSKFSVFCPNSSKMLGISLDEAVFNSASALYYDAKFMHWVVDKIPDQSLLNTAGWRFIIPQLYKKYPNRDMNLNVALCSPPIIKLSNQKADAGIFADLTIDVIEEDVVIPVACISLVIQGSGSVKITGNNLAGAVRLDDFVMSLKWSNIGNLRMYLIQPIVWTLIQTVLLPYANAHLGKGFPLPIIHGFTIQDAEIILTNSRVTVCSDVSYAELHEVTFFPL